MARKVKIDLILVGRSYRNIKELGEFNNLDFLYTVQDQVGEQFGRRALYMVDETLILNKSNYPEFYAAGWFTSDQPVVDTDGKGSELVVVAHGDTMDSARSAMMKAVEYVSWDELAANI